MMLLVSEASRIGPNRQRTMQRMVRLLDFRIVRPSDEYVSSTTRRKEKTLRMMVRRLDGGRVKVTVLG